MQSHWHLTRAVGISASSTLAGDGVQPSYLGRTAENRSLEESCRVDAPVASSFEACVRSGQIDCSLRWSGDKSRLSSLAIQLSERLVRSLVHFMLASPLLQLGASVAPPLLNMALELSPVGRSVAFFCNVKNVFRKTSPRIACKPTCHSMGRERVDGDCPYC